VKSVGITGPPGSGKTALWRAVSGGTAKGELAVVDVPEPRLGVLAAMEHSRKEVPIQIQVADVHAGARTPAAALGELRKMDALLLVVPAFAGGPSGEEAAVLAGFVDDLILADLGPFENRLARARKDPAARAEIPALEAGLAHLEGGLPLRTRPWEPGELRAFAPLAPITLKPVVVVRNVDEAGLAAPAPELGVASFTVSAALEAEVAGLDPVEARDLLAAYGVDEPVTGRVIDAVYRLLDLITFFTAGEKDAHAWEVRRGATAPEAAGVIHSDIQRGFIRAEIIGYEDLVAAGSWNAAKTNGTLRLEGKEYRMAEGDVCHFRFAV
jgi:ribosome-binding ATPase YchF (GTP1/OBG family)